MYFNFYIAFQLVCLQDCVFFSELSHYHGLLEELHQQQNNEKREKFEDLGFDEQKDIDMNEGKSGSKEVVLYNTVRNTFKKLINLCVLQKYGVSNT